MFEPVRQADEAVAGIDWLNAGSGNDREPRAGGDDVIGCELARVGNRQTQRILSRPQRQR